VLGKPLGEKPAQLVGRDRTGCHDVRSEPTPARRLQPYGEGSPLLKCQRGDPFQQLLSMSRHDSFHRHDNGHRVGPPRISDILRDLERHDPHRERPEPGQQRALMGPTD